MNHLCTYCDSGYAARLLCLHESLVATREPFLLHVLCFDTKVAEVIATVGAPTLNAIPLEEVLRVDPDFAAARAGRTKVEFFFTATPVFVLHCFRREPAAMQMTYVDADLFFFGPLSTVFAEQGDASIGIVEHRFPHRLKHLEKTGTYNVAWVSFRRDANGLACLDWWRERCLEWCHDRAENGRYADQGYLDEFPRRFEGVRVLKHRGIDLAPWNVDDAMVGRCGETVCVGEQPLLFYHFQGLRELLPGWFDPGLLFYASTMTPELRNLVYRPYLRRLTDIQNGFQRRHGIVPARGYHRLSSDASWSARWQRAVITWLLPLYRLMRGQLLWARAEIPRVSS